MSRQLLGVVEVGQDLEEEVRDLRRKNERLHQRQTERISENEGCFVCFTITSTQAKVLFVLFRLFLWYTSVIIKDFCPF